MNQSIEPDRNAMSADGGLARIERTFANLVDLVRARRERSDRLQHQAQQTARPSRSEIFKQVQHDKWIGNGARHGAAPSGVPPKDLYKRVLLDPNAAAAAASGRKPGAKTGH